MRRPQTVISRRARAETLNKIRVEMFTLGISQVDLANAFDPPLHVQYVSEKLTLAKNIKYGRAGNKPLNVSEKRMNEFVEKFEQLKNQLSGLSG